MSNSVKIALIGAVAAILAAYIGTMKEESTISKVTLEQNNSSGGNVMMDINNSGKIYQGVTLNGNPR